MARILAKAGVKHQSNLNLIAYSPNDMEISDTSIATINPGWYHYRGSFYCFCLPYNKGINQYWYSGTCLTRHTKRPGKCVRLYRMSEYSVLF